MHKLSLIAALLAISFGAQAADHNDLTAQDLAAIRAQLADMKQHYEQRIAALEQKLAATETRAPAPAPSVTPSAARSASSIPAANSFNPEVSLILQGQYRQKKSIPERRISGFVPAAVHNHDSATVDPANQRGFSLDHTELVLAANIDPNWRGQAILATLDGSTEVEEAWFQSLGLSHGMGLKAGRFRSGIGYLNEQHPHQWDFADAPLMYQALFGEHASYANDGVQLKWLAPTDTFIELGAEIGRGANFPGTERNKNGSNAAAVFAHLGGDVGIAHSWRAGLSYLNTRAEARTAHFEDINALEAQGAFSGRSATWIADLVWKWSPNGNPKYQNFKLQAEYFSRREQGDLLCTDLDTATPTACTGGVSSDYRSRQSGGYVQGVFQFTPQWRAGLRHERLDSGQRDFGVNAANLVIDAYKPQKTSAMVDYSWSEFSRLRLQYAQDKSMLGVSDNQVTVQYIMSLGAHGAHKF